MTLTRHNYEEFFLLYVDNELESEDRQSVEAFAKANPDLGEDLQQLQRAVLSSDEEVVSFDKALLYKKESAERAAIIPIWKWGLAAASVLLVATATFWALKARKDLGGPSVVSNTVARPAAATPPTPVTPAEAPQTTGQAVAVAPANSGPTSPASAHPEVAASKPAGSKQPSSGIGPSTIEANTPQLAVTQPSSNMPTAFTPIATAPVSPNSRSTAATAIEEKNSAAVTSATPVAYHTLEDTDGKNEEDKILFVRTDQVVGGDVKSFFRKAGRVLKHSTSLNTDNVHSDPGTDPK